MQFGDLMKNTYVPEKELVINKTFKVRGLDAALASVTLRNGRYVLWLLVHCPKPDGWTERPAMGTRRGIFRHVGCSRSGIYPSEVFIRGLKLTFGALIRNDEVRSPMLLQHFAEKGVDLSVFSGADASDVHVMTCQIEGGIPLSELPPPEDIIYKISAGAHPRYVGQAFELPFDTILPNARRTFFDTEAGVERCFYIHRLFRYDVQKQLNDEQLAYVKNEFEAAGYNADSLAFDLAAVEYEAEDDIQLVFYEKGVLDKDHTDNGTCIGFGYPPSGDLGPHGLKLQYCVLNEKYIPKDFKGSMTVELVIYNARDPEETIVI